MSNEKDWREDYAEAEVFVHVLYRHKITLKIPEGSTGEAEALKIMKAEPIEHWCDNDSLEGWVDSPHLFSREDDQFEICNVWTVEEAWGSTNSQEDREEIEQACYKFT